MKRGFTLIELLVVIAIISFVTSIVLTSLATARAKGRDTKRLGDLKSVQAALELYRNDNGRYPLRTNWSGTCANFGSYGVTGSGGYVPDLAPTYIKILPQDPKPSAGSCYLYTSNSTGSDYMFLIYGTVETGTIPSLLRQNNPGEQNYAVYSDGARLW